MPACPSKRHAGAAVQAARDLDQRVVIKVCSAQVAHRTELGGVRLDVRGDDEVREAYDAVTAGALAAGLPIDGVLVSPMRRGGNELIVGVVRDPDWGLLLAIGLGGELVELLEDVALRVLPIDAAEAVTMLGELRAKAVFSGFRGHQPVDLELLGDTIARIAGLASRLPEDVSALEVNPLGVSEDVVEALDVLTTRN